MRLARSNRYLLDPREKKTLARMAKNAEEGDASDGDSLEEITAADFRQDAGGLRSARVWMPDMSMYPMSRSFTTPNLYSFAWAQAVQNKPLGFEVNPVAEKDESCNVAVDSNSEEVGCESEKEEGELEEGEIELGSEHLVAPSSNESEKESAEEEPEEMDDIDSCVSQFLEELEMITVEEAESSFDAVCLRLRKSFESLKDMFLKNRVPVLDALVQQAFMGIQTIHSVLGSMKLKDKERNEDLLLRLLVHIKNQYSLLLTPERINEMDEMVKSVVSDNNMKEIKHGSSVNTNCNTNGLNSYKKPSFNQRTENNVINDSGMDSFAKLETPLIAKKRVEFTPLLDLHANYDESSLPSPTRETAPPLPLQKPVTPDRPMSLKSAGAQGDKLHLYHTDAIRAVSSYQQKYGQTSLSINRLPSPTPSDDCDVNDDTHGEVSSIFSGSNTRTVNYESSLQLLGNSSSSSSSGTITVSSTGFQTDPVKSLSPATKAPMKSRDPRLRMLNSEVAGTDVSNKVPMAVGTNTSNDLNMRKNKAVSDSTLDDHISKKQRNEFADSRDGETTTGSGGWLEGGSDKASPPSNKKPENGPNKKPECGTLSSGNDLAVTLPSLLKGIAVNPLMLMELLKMEQQRLAARVQQSIVSTHDTVVSSNSNILSTGASLANNVSVKPSEFELVSGPSQLSIQTTLMNPQTEAGTVRMKPRDPRRVLHNNVLHKGESSKSEPTNINRNPSPDGLNSHPLVRQQGQQAQTTILHTHRTPQPDISQPFTANLKNLADMISSSQSASMSSLVPQSSSQSTPTMMKAVNANPSAADLSDGGTPVAPQAPNLWGDVDHLLDGYDDQQKAAIQRERSRRIEQQNKMFAARKLCLVLDLDHTLLNSAKFIEVDPVHEEILRKKEEQDRENPQRHLFRFPHMGMWTKMRPGIWNFLERASKLFVLHLYTMGNKLYATEMAKVLDPKGTLFAGRVISRGDDGDVVDGIESIPKSKDLEGVLGMESAVVIIDDSVRVWPHNKLNLIVVERYTYFPCSRRQFGLLGPSLLEVDHDERPEDGTLSSSLAVIERIHHNFFSHRSMSEVDVRNILAAEQRKILAGCTILFSRIFPMGDANARMHPLWQTAEQFGASCTNQINEQVTHVVGNLLGTDKVNWGLSTGRFVVTPGWAEASALLYRRVNEHDFPVKEGPETGFAPPRSRR